MAERAWLARLIHLRFTVIQCDGRAREHTIGIAMSTELRYIYKDGNTVHGTPAPFPFHRTPSIHTLLYSCTIAMHNRIMEKGREGVISEE